MLKNKRILLDEKSASKSFLLEVDDRFMLEKAKGDPNVPIYMSGKIQEGDALNRNGRIYPWEILKKECIRYMEEEVASRQSIGELDHPEESAVPRLQFASHIIEDISFKGKEVWGKIKVLNAYMPENSEGRKVRGLILNGVVIGISSRSLGSVEEEYHEQYGEYEQVQEDLTCVCWDLVSRPSTIGSNMFLSEAVKPTLKKSRKIITEVECFGEDGVCACKIDNKKVEILSESEKVYLKILGVEKFLQIKNKNLHI